MRRAAAMVVATLVTLTSGCGGGSSSTGTGGHGGGAGAGGGAGITGRGGASGSLGTGGAGNGSGNLPACAVVQRPADPVNPSGGNIDPTNGTCNTLQLDGTPVASEPLDAVDAGVREDGGAIETAAGGTILDGDYDFVRWQDEPGDSAVRKIRVFGGGTYIEWADSSVPANNSSIDSGFVNLWFDTTVEATGTTLTFTYTCSFPVVPSYGYTARGDDLLFFDYRTSAGGAETVFSVDTYRRTCTRP